MINNMTGSKIRMVSGYPGTREITLAIEKDEVKGLCGFSWSSLKAQRPNWVVSGFIRVLVQEHDKGNPEINNMGVPLAVDFATTAANRRVMDLIYSSETFGRPYMMAPGVPQERVAALRKAFMATMRDEELLAEARHIAFKNDAFARRARFGHRHGREQRLGIGMLAGAENLPLAPKLDDLAEVHDRNPMSHVLDDGEIVADEEKREAKLALQILQQVHDLRLDRNIECRDRLVADDEVGLGRESARNGDALTLSAGEFVRPARLGLARQPQLIEQEIDARLHGGGGVCQGELADRLRRKNPHAHTRIKARGRILEHAPHAA